MSVDVGWGDLIDYFGSDPRTQTILLHMETMGNVRSFLSSAREVSLKKPIIVIKSGRSEAARGIAWQPGRAMLDALVAGETDPQRLAKLAKGSLIPKMKPLAEALRGGFTSHHAFLLGQMLTQLDQLAAMVAECDVRILEVSKPIEANIQRLQTIVGVGRRSAEVMVSEIGVDMSRFSTAGHLASWARICPGSYESAGKRRSAGTGTRNNWLRTTLLESAWAAAHTRKSYLGAQFRRISKRRGPKRAGIAMLTTCSATASTSKISEPTTLTG